MKAAVRSLAILLSVMMILSMAPLRVNAEQVPVSYMTPDGSMRECTDYTPVSEETTVMEDGWYVVDRDVTFSRSVTVKGKVNLILCDGVSMYANKGILVRAKDHADLTIWGQRTDAGKLIAQGDGSNDVHSAGIGTDEGCKDVGPVTINGGEITATGGTYAAGIGAGRGGRGGTVVIAGGIVTAKGGTGSVPAIGANLANKGDLTVYDLACVKAGSNDSVLKDNPVLESARAHECQFSHYARIEPCTHSQKEYEINETGHRIKKCLYCKLPAETSWTPHKMVNGQCTVCGYREKIVPDNSGRKNSGQKSAEEAIRNSTSDEGPSGTVFHLLQARQKKTTKHSITITWNKIPGASYMIFGNKCGRKNKYLKIAETGKTKITFRKLGKGKYYKFIVLAVKDGNAVSVSKTLHIATAGGKYGNHKKVTISKKKLTLKKGTSKKLKAKAYIGKLKVKVHRSIRWESSNPNVVTVKKGKIKAVGKGTAKIYAYAQNGKFAKCKVTVN